VQQPHPHYDSDKAADHRYKVGRLWL
jgi:hypothetical protein